jgi:hypothetical protein
MQIIYGADIYLGNDSQDAQLINVFATVLSDQASGVIAVYNSYSPTTAQGVGLSSVVKTNGITRDVASYSTVGLLVVAQVGLPLNNCSASDGIYTWSIPNGTLIPSAGELLVTATCTTIGAINAAPGAIDIIATPTAGWQSVTNPAAAVPGLPVETDPQLRARQYQSTMISSKTLTDGIVGAILSLPEVVACTPYDNDTSTTNSLGIPASALSLVITGGVISQIASTLFLLKGPGDITYGTTNSIVYDSYGVPHQMNWFSTVMIPISVVINIHNLPGYSTAIGAQIMQSVVNYINALPSGQSVLLPRVGVPAQLVGPSAVVNTTRDPNTFELVSILMSRAPAIPTASDVAINFYEQATCSLAIVSLNVV